jgi:hypothetical protein
MQRNAIITVTGRHCSPALMLILGDYYLIAASSSRLVSDRWPWP